MMEQNHRNANRQYRVFSVPEEDPGSHQVTEKVTVIGNHGFPRRSWLSDDPIHDGSENFVPHVITRMPDLTGYGHDTAPQSFSLSRPQDDRWTFARDILKKLPRHQWKYVAAIAVVVAFLVWSLFRGSGSQQVAQNSQPDTPKIGNVSKDNATDRESSIQESNKWQFDGFNSGFPPIPTSSTSADQPMFSNSTTASQVPQIQYFGTGTPQFSSGMAQVAMMPPDTPPRDLAPWERQPNHPTAGTTPMSSQFDFAGNGNLPMTASAGHVMANNHAMANNVPNSSWQGSNPNVGTPQWNSNNPQPYSEMPGNTPYIAQQNVWQQNAYQANIPPQNGQFQPASPQQSYFQQYPTGNDQTIAMNTVNMPSYPQGQGQIQGPAQGQTQWPPQNPGNVNNDSVPQQPYPGNSSQNTAGSQFAVQNNPQFAPQQRQQPFPPYNNMAVSPSPEMTYR